MTVSIIIPVYNAQRTLRRCLTSVLNQTYRNLEIVVVNDGSSDGSIKEIERQKEKDRRIIAIHQDNEGVEKARLKGIQESEGEFVTFLDADDYLEPNAVELLVAVQRKYNADLVQCGMDTFVTVGSTFTLKLKREKHVEGGVKLYGKEQIMNRLYMSFFGCGGFGVNVWSKFYRRDLLDDLKSGGLDFGEDLYLNMQVFPRLNSICAIPDKLYHYERQGITSRYMPAFLEQCRKLYLLKAEKATEIHSEEAQLYSAIELRNCVSSHTESMILHRVGSQYDIERWLRHELEDKTYDVFNRLQQQEGFNNSPMAQAVVNKDVETIYQEARKSVYEWKWKKVARRLLIHLN